MKKVLSMLLVLCMVLGMSVSAFALSSCEPGCRCGCTEFVEWDGTTDTSWYNDTDTEFVLTNPGQLAGLAELVDGGNTFEGKTIKLGANIDLGNKLFNPIGSYRKEKAFAGVFDGQGATIANLSQNTWELDTGYYYGDLGLGLFGLVENAVIKNLNIDGVSISGESAICAAVAACAYGECKFENITVSDAQIADYQYYAGSIVGWASGEHLYKNIYVDDSTTIAAQWGDFDNATGGVIGGCSGNAKILMKDCTIACRIDAYNDVTSSYQWYAYRRCGMLIGNTGKTEIKGDTTYASAPQLTCENVNVVYGDWANYHYCEFAGTNWPYVRVEAGVSNSAYSNPRYGHPTDANGNEVVDDNHVHNEGEDHMILCLFDQLYGGGQGVYGTSEHEGVTESQNLNPPVTGSSCCTDGDTCPHCAPKQETPVEEKEEEFKTTVEIKEDNKGNENGNITVSDKKVTRGEKVTLTVTPEDGYELALLMVIDEDGNERKVSENEDGTFSFRMPNSNVTVKTEFVKIGTVVNTAPTVEAEKENPSTGASNFVGTTVALAVCSAVGMAALSFKK